MNSPTWLNKAFAESFWPNFLADIGVGLLLAWLLGDALESASRLDYKLQMKPIGKHEIIHSKTIEFFALNNGQECFKDRAITWNIFVDEDLFEPDVKVDYQEVTLLEKTYRHYTGMVEFPLVPGSRARLREMRLIRPNDAKSSMIYFYFGTTQGIFPPTVRLDAEGLPDLNTHSSNLFSVADAAAPCKVWQEMAAFAASVPL